MTVSSTNVSNSYTGNGSTTSWPITFYAPDVSHIFVAVDGVNIAANAYSVLLNSDQSANPGGTVTYPLSGSPLASPHVLTITRTLPETQTTQIPSASGFLPKVIESALDWITLLVQQVTALPRVTSVGLAVPNDKQVSGSPVTGSGTITVSDKVQSPNLVKASSSNPLTTVQPTYRSLVQADLPTITANINAQTGTSYTLALTDAGLGNLATFDNASPITVTVPLNATVAFPVNSVIHLAQTGDGVVTVSGASGVTIISAAGVTTLAKGVAVTLVKLATDTWLLASGG